MSRLGKFLLALDSDRWRVVKTGTDHVELHEVAFDGREAAADEVLERLNCVLAEMTYQGEGICLGLPSQMVLAAQIDCGDLPRTRRSEAMLYRLEEQLPLEAEGLTAQFLPAQAARTLGLAVRTQQVGAILDRLSGAGIEVAAICPTALLALWETTKGDNDRCDYAIVTGPDGVDVFRMCQSNVPLTWYSSPPEATELTRCIQADLLISPIDSEKITATLIGQLDGDTVAAVVRQTDLEVRPSGEESVLMSAAQAAQALLAGRPAGWVDFRTGDLSAANPWGHMAGLLRSAVVLGLSLLVVLTGMFFWRASRYASAAEQFEQGQVGQFRRLYPNRQVPISVSSRLVSELARLTAISGAAGELPQRPSALDSLRSIAAGLPDLRFRIVQLRIGPDHVLIEGQCRTHSDAEAVARALGRAGLSMDPPRTESLVGGGVAFTLAGTPAGPATLTLQGDKQ